jgi:hypothetical protein
MSHAFQDRGVESCVIGRRFHTISAAEAALYRGDYSEEITQYVTVDVDGERVSVQNPEWTNAEYEIGLWEFKPQAP